MADWSWPSASSWFPPITPPDPAVIAAGGDAARAAGKTQLYLLYLYYGVIAGLGGGCVYLPPIATAPKWWPDRRAFATGFAVVGLGLGSFIMAPLATVMINHFGSALPVFKYVGVAMGIHGCLCIPLPESSTGSGLYSNIWDSGWSDQDRRRKFMTRLSGNTPLHLAGTCC